MEYFTDYLKGKKNQLLWFLLNFCAQNELLKTLFVYEVVIFHLSFLTAVLKHPPWREKKNQFCMPVFQCAWIHLRTVIFLGLTSQDWGILSKRLRWYCLIYSSLGAQDDLKGPKGSCGNHVVDRYVMWNPLLISQVSAVSMAYSRCQMIQPALGGAISFDGRLIK